MLEKVTFENGIVMDKTILTLENLKEVKNKIITNNHLFENLINKFIEDEKMSELYKLNLILYIEVKSQESINVMIRDKDEDYELYPYFIELELGNRNKESVSYGYNALIMDCELNKEFYKVYDKIVDEMIKVYIIERDKYIIDYMYDFNNVYRQNKFNYNKLTLELLEEIKENNKERYMLVELIDTLLKNKKIFELISLNLEMSVDIHNEKNSDYIYLTDKCNSYYIFLLYNEQRISYGNELIYKNNINFANKIDDNIINNILESYSYLTKRKGD